MQFWRVASGWELALQPLRATLPQPRSRICSFEYDFFDVSELSPLCSGSTGFVRELGIIGACGAAHGPFRCFLAVSHPVELDQLDLFAQNVFPENIFVFGARRAEVHVLGRCARC